VGLGLREGLIDIRPQHATVVSRIDAVAAAQVQFLRRSIEAEVVRTLVGHADAALVDQLRAQIDVQAALMSGAAYLEFIAAELSTPSRAATRRRRRRACATTSQAHWARSTRSARRIRITSPRSNAQGWPTAARRAHVIAGSVADGNVLLTASPARSH